MKNALIVIIIIALLSAGIWLFASGTFEQLMHPGQTQIAGKWIDDSEIAKYDFDFTADPAWFSTP